MSDKKLTQAERIFSKFGGPTRLFNIMCLIGKRGRDKATIYRWNYSRARGGTDGLIPTSAWPDVLAAARFDGIIITPEDLDPREYEE
jgi:hypothetical protein